MGINFIIFQQLKFKIMGFWDFLPLRKNQQNDVENLNNNQEFSDAGYRPVDQNLFVEEALPTNNFGFDSDTSWKRIFDRIRKDYELEGYNDALSTPDNKYRDENLDIIKLDLLLDIQEAEIDLAEYLKEVEFHISTRTKAELFDLVEELQSKKEICEERIVKMKELKKEIQDEEGTGLRILLAYKRGFNKGLAALSVANILNRKI